MKITNVTPWIINGPAENAGVAIPDDRPTTRQYVFVQVETDEGLTGWGEITTYPGPVANPAISGMLREVRPLLVGQDANRIEAVWQRIFQAFTYVGSRGATTAMISAIDIALWDIKGQALGVPIYELLGGAVRETIPLYTHYGYSTSIDEVVQGALTEVRAGVRAIKTDPFFAEHLPKSIAYTDGQISAAGEQAVVEMIAAVREAVGPEIELLIDVHAMYNVPTAVRLAHRLAPYDITWFEEPVPTHSYAALAQVRSQVPTRICVGERLYTRFEFAPLFEQRLSDFVMPDVTWSGGISELKKIATMAEAYYIPVSPHDASGPVNILAGAHVMMTVPNFYKLEARRADMAFYNAFIDEPLVVQNGDLHVPNRPGLGLTMNMDYFRANAAPGWGG